MSEQMSDHHSRSPGFDEPRRPSVQSRGASADGIEEGRGSPRSNRSGAFTAPSISLPKGGGALRGIDEKITVNAATGTSKLDIPIPVTDGRVGFTPGLALSYDSGSGNGPFGLGWSLTLPGISRKTAQGLPRYRDAEESDVFVLDGEEDLVPVVDAQGVRASKPRTVGTINYQIDVYRPRVEQDFSRIERWTNRNSGDVHWRTITGDNETSIYGDTDDTRVFDPADRSRVFRWLVSRTYDARGNVLVYEYEAEDTVGVPDAVHERKPQRGGQPLPSRSVSYGHATPYFPGNGGAIPGDWRFRGRARLWRARPRGTSGRQGRGLARAPGPVLGVIAQGSRFARTDVVAASWCSTGSPSSEPTPRLVRSLDLHYAEEELAEPAASRVASFLTSLTLSGYVKEGQVYAVQSFPPLELEYSPVEVDPTGCGLLEEAEVENLPEGVDGRRYRWMDLHGEGLQGVLTEQGDGWYFKSNDPHFGDGEAAPRAGFPPRANDARVPIRVAVRAACGPRGRRTGRAGPISPAPHRGSTIATRTGSGCRSRLSRACPTSTGRTRTCARST